MNTRNMRRVTACSRKTFIFWQEMGHQTTRTASSGAIIMTTAMDSQFTELDASSRGMLVLMTPEVVGLFFTQNKVAETQSEENICKDGAHVIWNT